MRHLGKNISKQGKNFKEEMPALLLRQYSKSYGVVPARHIVLGKPNRGRSLTSRGVLQNARRVRRMANMMLSTIFRAFCKTPLLVRPEISVSARIVTERMMCLPGTTHRTGPLSRPLIPTFRDTAPRAGAENHKKKVFQACCLSCNFALEKLCIAQ